MYDTSNTIKTEKKYLGISRLKYRGLRFFKPVKENIVCGDYVTGFTQTITEPDGRIEPLPAEPVINFDPLGNEYPVKDLSPKYKEDLTPNKKKPKKKFPLNEAVFILPVEKRKRRNERI